MKQEQLAALKFVRPVLLKAIEALPLANGTLQNLKIIAGHSTNMHQVYRLATLSHDYHTSLHDRNKPRQIKNLEEFINEAHVISGATKRLPHLVQFKKYYNDMLSMWPYERHIDTVKMTEPRLNSIIYKWRIKHTYEIDDLTKCKPLVAGYEFILPSNKRKKLLDDIFKQVLYLNSKPDLMTVPIMYLNPILEIPMTSLASSIPLKRVRRLRNIKVNNTYELLTNLAPALNLTQEKEISYIFRSELKTSRELLRLYSRVFSKSYVYDPTIVNSLPYRATKLELM